MSQNYNTSRFPGEHLTGDIEFFTTYTLVDVTDSRVTHPSQSQTKEYNQAQNLNVLLQTVGLRAQPVVSSVLLLENEDVSEYNFGTAFTGSHSIWVVKFATEYVGAWEKDGDSLYHLNNDTNQVAIAVGLDETATIDPALFDTSSSNNKNIYFNRNNFL